MTILQPTRRGFIGGLIGIIAAPAIVRYANLMPVKAPKPIIVGGEFTYTITGWDAEGNIMRELISAPPKFAMSAMQNAVGRIPWFIDRIECSTAGTSIIVM